MGVMAILDRLLPGMNPGIHALRGFISKISILLSPVSSSVKVPLTTLSSISVPLPLNETEKLPCESLVASPIRDSVLLLSSSLRILKA